jgi:hypothetical protein
MTFSSKWYGPRASAAAARAAQDGLVEAGDRLLDRSNELVPVDEGELRDSGMVEPLDHAIQVVYTAEHAVPVHERTEVRHRQGRSKFLEQPLAEFGDELLRIVGNSIDRALR